MNVLQPTRLDRVSPYQKLAVYGSLSLRERAGVRVAS
jgi:hypothetical protein